MTFLLDTAIRTSLLLSVALAGAMILQRHSAAFRHFLLAAAIASCAAMPAFEAALPAWYINTGWLQATARLRPDVAITTETSLQPVQSQDAQQAHPSRATGTSLFSRAAVRVLVASWTAGVVVMLSMLAIGLARLSRLASTAPRINGRQAAIAAEIAGAIGLRRPVTLLQSEHPSVTATWGAARPAIVLPAGASNWTDDRLRIVLRHELAHVRRGDWAAQMLAEVTRAFYWFNPLLWLACRRLRDASERACDDAVLNGGVGPAEYATHLLEVARSFAATRAPGPALAMARSSGLEGRISAMLDTRRNRGPLTAHSRVAIASAVLALALPVAIAAQSQFSTLSGTVVDQTNRILPDVTLTLSNASARSNYEVRSDRNGHFEFVGLPSGTYELKAAQPGFKTLVQPVSITGSDVSRNLQLEIGSIHETITITQEPAAAGDSADREHRTEEAVAHAKKFRQEAAERCAATAAPDVGGNILAPLKVKDVRPIYPEQLKAAKVSGVVVLDAVIGTDGTVREVKTVSPMEGAIGTDRSVGVSTLNPELVNAAIDAVRQWEFTTTYLNCAPVEVHMTVTVNFVTAPK